MTIFSIGNHIWKGGNMTTKETLKVLKKVESSYKSKTVGSHDLDYQFEDYLKALSHAIQIIEAYEQAGKELEKK